jgi:subtilisin family serine protease
MSNKSARILRASLVVAVVAAVSACQDAVAPLAPASSMQSPTVSFSKQNGKGRQLIDGQYIVVFKDGSGDVDALTQRLNGKAKGKVKHAFKNGIKGFAGAMTAEAAAVLSKDPSVAYVEQDAVVSLDEETPATTDDVSALLTSSASIPSQTNNGKKSRIDPASGSTVGPWTEKNVFWNLDRIDQLDAKFNGTYIYNATGSGVNVYIIDSGIRLTHAEFDGRATSDFSTINDGHDTDGCLWHGTHVAGTVGGTVYGVAKAVRLHSVRAFDCAGNGSTSDILTAIEWVITNAVRPAVTNMSFTDDLSPVMNDAIARAVASGIVMVAAAGNHTVDACGASPASAPEAITVAASGMQDYLAAYSNFGSCIDIIAPGDAMSAYSIDDTSIIAAAGTSMAAPQVAGAAAMYLQMNPAATPAMVEAALMNRASAGRFSYLPPATVNLLLRIP